MVQQIITAFRAKHKFNLTNDRLKAFADKAATKIEKEEDIEAFIDDLDVDYLKEIAKLDDAVRTAELKAKGDTPTEPEPGKEDENPALKMVQELKAEIEAMKSGSLVSDRKAVLKAALKDANENVVFLADSVDVSGFKSEDEFNTYVTNLTEKSNAINEALKVNSSSTKPLFGAGSVVDKKVATEEDDIVKNFK